MLDRGYVSFAAEPAAHLALARMDPAYDIASHSAVAQNRPGDAVWIAQHFVPPVGEEGFTLAGRKVGHLVGDGVALLLEEDRQILFGGRAEADIQLGSDAGSLAGYLFVECAIPPAGWRIRQPTL